MNPEATEVLGRLRRRLLSLDDPPSASFGDLRPAAVLIVLYPLHDDLGFPLIVRPDTMPHHPGQIALPGGRYEPMDGTTWATALRETAEELGMDVQGLEPLGRLPHVQVAVSGHRITPYVAWAPARPALQPNQIEVAEVIEVTLGTLRNPANVAEEQWELRGGRWHVTFYLLAGRRVWGATARILSDLNAALDPERHQEPRPGSVRPAP